jgi:hypothetical protein
MASSVDTWDRVIGGRIRAERGFYAGLTGTLVEADEDCNCIEVFEFGHRRVEAVDSADTGPPLEDPRPTMRDRIAEDAELELEELGDDWWLPRLSEPGDADRLCVAWDAFERYLAGERARLAAAVAERLREYAARFDDEALRAHGEQGLWERWGAAESAARLTPWMLQADRRVAGRYGVTPEQLRARARRWDAGYAHFRRALVADQGAVDARRAAARERVLRVRDAARARVQATHGVVLPDSLFLFAAFWQSLDETERAFLERDLGLGQLTGVCDDLAGDAPRPPGERDPRLGGREATDPPEFFPFLRSARTDVRFGLWYDEPAGGAAGVARTDANRFVELRLCVGLSPLQALRGELETAVGDVAQDRTMRARTYRLAFVREALCAFETGERPERAYPYVERHPYLARYRPERTRVPTADGAGAWLPGDAGALLYRYPGAIVRALVERDPAVEVQVARALEQLAAGDPGDALALGRDLHWWSGRFVDGQWGQQRAWAAQVLELTERLLVGAYHALGRPALAEIARVHIGARRAALPPA